VLDSNSYSGDTSDLENAPEHSPATPPSSSGPTSDELYSELEETVDDWVEEYSEDSSTSPGQEIFDRLTEFLDDDLQKLIPKKIPCSQIYDHATAFTYTQHRHVRYGSSSSPLTFKGRLGKRTASTTSSIDNKNLWRSDYGFGDKKVLVPIPDMSNPDKIKFWAVYAPRPEVSVLSLSAYVKVPTHICRENFYHNTEADHEHKDYFLSRQNLEPYAKRWQAAARAAKLFRVEEQNEQNWSSKIKEIEDKCEDLVTCTQAADMTIEHALDNPNLIDRLSSEQHAVLSQLKDADDAFDEERNKTKGKFLITEMCHLEGTKGQLLYDQKYQEARAADGNPVAVNCSQSSVIEDYLYSDSEEGEEFSSNDTGYPRCIIEQYARSTAVERNRQDIETFTEVHEATFEAFKMAVPVAGEAYQAYICREMALEIPLREDFSTANAFTAAERLHKEQVDQCWFNVQLSAVGTLGGALKVAAAIDDIAKLASQVSRSAIKTTDFQKVANLAGDSFSILAGSGFAIESLADMIESGPNVENMTALGLSTMDFAQLAIRPAYKRVKNAAGIDEFVEISGKKNVLTAAKCEVCAAFPGGNVPPNWSYISEGSFYAGYLSPDSKDIVKVPHKLDASYNQLTASSKQTVEYVNQIESFVANSTANPNAFVPKQETCSGIIKMKRVKGVDLDELNGSYIAGLPLSTQTQVSSALRVRMSRLIESAKAATGLGTSPISVVKNGVKLEAFIDDGYQNFRFNLLESGVIEIHWFDPVATVIDGVDYSAPRRGLTTLNPPFDGLTTLPPSYLDGLTTLP
jgi:hypothetical protein